MNDYADRLRAHRRIAVLRHLEAAPEYVSNAAILAEVLAGLGLSVTRDQLLGELGWLREQGFVEFDPAAAFTVVVATRRGVEIARGLATHPGVHRPGPRL